VVGVADPLKGEIAAAFVVLRGGSRPAEAELLAYCREHLAAYKVPRRCAFVEELPKSPSREILKRTLREFEQHR
jgi:long-chain acyl-CoA synthetase